MKDIRNFFGGGGGASSKPVEPPKIEKSKAKTFSQKNDEDDDFLMESSDEEWKSDNKQERKRLKGKNIKSPAAATRMTTSESIESTTVKEVRTMIPTVIDLEDEIMTKSVPTSPAAVKAEVASPVNKIVLPVMKTSVKPSTSDSTAASGDKKRKEVDPNAYFGLPTTPTKSARSPPAKKVKAEPTNDDDDVEEVKSPAAKRKAASAAASKDKSNGGWQVNELKFVITGVLNSGSREDVESMILSAGGKIAKAVSGKTDYLVTGVLLEDGRPVSEGSKYKTAVEKGVKIVGEEQLMSMLAADAEKKSKEPASAAPAAPVVKIESKAAFGSLFGSSSSSSSSSGNGNKSQVNDEADMLWVDKHKPKNSSELIGSAELVRKMADWLKKWDEVHIKKTHKVPFSKENPGARAVLLSGPPGIGKTTVATLIAREFGFDVLELNASDTRNKKEIGDQLTDAVMSKAIGSMSFLGSSSCLKKRLIIMDEVDGMGGSDRGGVAELIKIIKTTKTPIVCICNDRQSPKIKSLVNHCYDLKVKRPTKQQIAQRLVQIAAKEGMTMEQNAGEILVEQVGNDIRQALNTMQMWRAAKNTMQFTDVKNAMNRIEKDKVLRQTPFDACLQILGGSKAPLDDRYNSFFIDYSLLPLMVQQNYIDSAKNGIFKQPALSEADRMDQLARASDAVSDVDMIGSRIMGQDQHWELLPAQAAFCVQVGTVVQGFQAFPSFPAWLGKNSSQNKMSRLTKEIVHHSSLSIGQGFCPIRLDYVPYVRETLLSLLLNPNNTSNTTSDSEEGSSGDGISQVIDMLDAYGLSREDMMETLREMQFVMEGDKQFRDRYEGIETKMKTALTKAYNNSAHRSQVLVSEIASKGKKGRGGGGGGARSVAFDEDGNMIEDESAMAEEEEQVEEEEDDNIDAFIAKSKKAKAADKATKAAAKSSAGGGKGKK